jgi:rRNA maturation protein Nop10
VYLGALGGSATGSSPPRYSADQIRHGKNRIWKKLGHERMGYTMSKKTPAILN